jgi:kinesin family protein 11
MNPSICFQKEVYDLAIAPAVQDVVHGYNCTVFAYGQTGTGKTYTMEGARSDPHLPWDEDPTGGMIPRAVHHLFDELRAVYDMEVEKPAVVLSVSYFELYNENVYDLLAAPEGNGPRPILQ